jgi:hypothetical protein
MSADRENHDMTHSDIALLLADATDEVEIGTAPCQAVIRGGRRRRARRWAVAGATALVLASSSATLAVAGLPGGGGERVSPPATQPSTTGVPNVFQPHNTRLLATGTDQGTQWSVSLDIWPAPRDETEARAQLNAMKEYGETPTDARTPAELVGKTAYFLRRSVGAEDLGAPMMNSLTTKADAMSGTDLVSVAVPVSPASDGPDRLVIGHVAKGTRQVTCTWKNGTKTEVDRAPGADVNSDQLSIRSIEGAMDDWFVCLAPAGTEYESAEVTEPGR